MDGPGPVKFHGVDAMGSMTRSERSTNGVLLPILHLFRLSSSRISSKFRDIDLIADLFILFLPVAHAFPKQTTECALRVVSFWHPARPQLRWQGLSVPRRHKIVMEQFSCKCNAMIIMIGCYCCHAKQNSICI